MMKLSRGAKLMCFSRCVSVSSFLFSNRAPASRAFFNTCSI